MKIQLTEISKIKANPDNPRVIKDDKFKKLVKSIQEFPQMMQIRPIVVNDEMMILGGNMRLRACIEAGLKKVHYIKAVNLTPEQQKEFIIKDNSNFGEWDWDTLANEWDDFNLSDWGLDVPKWNENYYDIDENKEQEEKLTPSSYDDKYSSFEIIMLYDNKLKLIEVLNEIKTKYMLNKQEEALMELIKLYSK